MLYLMPGSALNFCRLSEAHKWVPRLPTFANWITSRETSCSKGPGILSHRCSCKSSWESQSQLAPESHVNRQDVNPRGAQTVGFSRDRTGEKRGGSYGQSMEGVLIHLLVWERLTGAWCGPTLCVQDESLGEFQHRAMATAGRLRVTTISSHYWCRGEMKLQSHPMPGSLL